jgi:agmatine/peptidylarginine deiminase
MRSGALRSLTVAVALFPCHAAAQNAPTVPGRDVVILALGSDDSGEQSVLRAAMKLTGQRPNVSTVRDVQMDILRKTATFGPVLLLAPDDEARTDITSNCSALEVCSLLADGRVRIAVVPHDTPWIRDYGPFIESSGTDVRVVDSAYYDVREDHKIDRVLKALLQHRLELLKGALGPADGEGQNPFDLGTGGRSAAEVDSRIGLLKQFSDALRESTSYGQRATDDRAPFAIAQAVLAGPGFSVSSTKLFVDGGNLLKLDDGACLTTKELHTRNPDKHNVVVSELKTAYGCSDVVFLEALPGPVIEHVDMFVLPIGGKRLALPNFNLDQPHIIAGWSKMNEAERDLTLQAALTIESNASVLRGKGYELAFIPALTPRASANGDVYYPTMLNALVRSNGLDGRQVLVPLYRGLQDDVQQQALKLIEAEFGPHAQVLGVEATVAARGQGAIHCLTITVPYAISVFHTGFDLSFRRLTELKQQLDAANRLLTNPTLTGAWSASRPGELKPKNDAISMTVAFAEDGKIRLTVAGQALSGTYKVIEDPNMKWPLEIEMGAGDPTRASPQAARKIVGRVDWVTDKLFRLVLSEGDALLMKRVLSLTELEIAGREIVVGSSRSGVLKDSDERDASGSLVQAWAINGRAGEAVVVDLISDTFDTMLNVVGPGLSRPLYDDDSGGDLNSRLRLEFPETGVYKVIVQAVDSSESGEFTVKAMPAPADESVADWEDEAIVAFLKALPVRQELQVDRVLNAELGATTAKAPNGRLAQAWMLDRCDGGRVRVSVKSDDFDTVLVVFGSTPDDKPLINDDDETELLSSNSTLEFDCSSATARRVVVSTFGPGESGAFSVEVKPVAK